MRPLEAIDPKLIVMFERRQYQYDATNAVILDLWGKGMNSTALVMATGTGKTHVLSMICQRVIAAKDKLATDNDKRILVLAHKDQLLNQLEDKLRSACVDIGLDPWSVYREQGSIKAKWFNKIVVSTPITMRNRLRDGAFKTSDFCLVVVDETHRAISPSYLEVCEKFLESGAKLLGLTATFFRTDGVSLGRIYEQVSYEYDIFSATKDGYLCPIIGPSIENDHFDISKIKLVTKHGEKDFSMRQVSQAIKNSKMIEKTMPDLLARSSERPSIVFCSSIDQAVFTSNLIESYGKKSRAISSRPEHKCFEKEIYERFKNDEFQYLCCMDMVTEGVDLPNASCAIFFRPTQSPVLWWQMLGRIVRLHEGKENGLLLDYVGVSKKHDDSAVNAFSLLWPWMDEVDKGIAKRLSKEGKSISEIRDIVKEKRESRKPLEIGNYLDRVAKKKEIHMATSSQIDKLKSHGVGERKSRGMSKERAEKQIRYLERRERMGLATYRQTILLKRFRVPNFGKMTREEAGSFLGKIKSVGVNGKWPDPIEVRKAKLF